jgi:hypothetical protein
VTVSFVRARAARPGFLVWAVFAGVAAVLAACADLPPEPPAVPRTWEGPGENVTSTGTTSYTRREIAQTVSLPVCIQVGPRAYRYARVSTFAGPGANPPGLFDSQYRLDRWRIWTRAGPLALQETLFLTVRGSTGILAEYEPSERPCAGT